MEYKNKLQGIFSFSFYSPFPSFSFVSFHFSVSQMVLENKRVNFEVFLLCPKSQYAPN
ncbi:hypothetical protein RhiirA5_440095 [Rhizophagus irregularis]|uniref:Uncharacterized protein n=1 Tax=Rhizophagus irregularis TaxID=588596 RepID=A0A2N0NH14_9GLOM|nr:hypothetical protein RhiirA5_440095 [Rhizophagus irregularis]PKC72837.1 hypothetical protein RhiirA1_451831 [Rhizophagus irregularis]